MAIRLRSTVRRQVGLGFAAGLLVCGAACADAWLTVPSSDSTAGAVSVNGGGFEPGGQVLLSLSDGDGFVVETRVVDVDDSGAFTAEVPGAKGGLLEAYDLAGQGDEPAASTPVISGGP